MDEKVFYHAANASPGRPEWTNEQVVHLIELYRDHHVLWDSRLGEHKDRDLRHNALMKLASVFGVSKEEIERKIKNLLSHFAREVKKELAAFEDNVCYRSKWLYYEKLQFLKQRKRRRSVADVEFMKTESEGFDVVLLPTTSFFDDHESEQPPETAEADPMFVPPEKKYASAQIPHISTSMTVEQEMVAFMREMHERQNERDEYALFGEQVALKLRKLASPHARFMVQHIINSTFFEAEMGKYDSASSSSFSAPVLHQHPGAQPKKDRP